MNKITIKKNTNYTTISNVFLRDERLSLKAKGFLALVMSLPDEWDFSIEGICSILPEGKTAIYSAIKELKQTGYCTIEINRNEYGRVIGNDYTFYEEPIVDNQGTVQPDCENLNVDDKTQISKDIINKRYEEIKEQKEKENFQKKEETAQEIVDFYNEHTDANDFPRTKKASEKIKSSIKARIKAGYTMQDIKTAILLMPTLSDWYKGKNDRCWKADLLWLLNDTKGNFARILDGGLHQSPVQKHQYDIIMASNGVTDPNEYHPICDGYFIKYDPNLKGYLLVGRHPQKFNVPDGYTETTRPDGAILYSQYGRFKWNGVTRKWDESFVIF